ncbi:Hypothetical predicted protein [Octopus vulgaris]|uniref:Uncharacterized protein n=1 Tax=Octopus vulgaris TaxID=6645 RepID=A0AA36BBT4_OCTVU|nr:Hypothetical predicted protein [Octopus vulgaris]
MNSPRGQTNENTRDKSQVDSKKNIITESPDKDSQTNLSGVKNPTETKPISAKRRYASSNKMSLLERSSGSDCEPISEHRRPQYYEGRMVGSFPGKSYKTSNLNQELSSKMCSVYYRSPVPCSGENTKIISYQKERRKSGTSNIRESETQTEASSFSIVYAPKIKTQNASTQTCFWTRDRFTQTPFYLPTEREAVAKPCSVTNVDYPAINIIPVQSALKKVEKRVRFEENLNEEILTWTHVYNEPLRKTPLSWSGFDQFCEETKSRKANNPKDMHCNNVEIRSDNPLTDICPNPEIGLMGALGLTQNLNKNTTLSNSNQNLRFQEFDKKDVAHGTNENTSIEGCQSKRVKSCLKKGPSKTIHYLDQRSPHCIKILTKENFDGICEESIINTVPVTSLNQILSANKDTVLEKGLHIPLERQQLDTKTSVERQDNAKMLQIGKFKISISDVLPRYRSVSNELIRTSAEIAETIGVKSASRIAIGCNYLLKPSEEVIIFYSGYSNDLHCVTTDIWNRTVKLYSHDNITLSTVINIAKEKLDTRNIVGIWNLGIQRVCINILAVASNVLAIVFIGVYPDFQCRPYDNSSVWPKEIENYTKYDYADRKHWIEYGECAVDVVSVENDTKSKVLSLPCTNGYIYNESKDNSFVSEISDDSSCHRVILAARRTGIDCYDHTDLLKA